MAVDREIFHSDAITWLQMQGELVGCSIVTSLPDKSEFPNLTILEWQDWFVRAAGLVLSKCPDEGVTIFYQSDIKVDGVWIDKGYLVQKAAENLGHSLLAHKIICRGQIGLPRLGRPTYSHLLCFSKNTRIDPAKGIPDVLPEAGETTWTRGMGVKACELACKIILAYTNTRTVVDPFCGHGTVLAIANKMGLKAIGNDISAKCVRKARVLEFS